MDRLQRPTTPASVPVPTPRPNPTPANTPAPTAPATAAQPAPPKDQAQTNARRAAAFDPKGVELGAKQAATTVDNPATFFDGNAATGAQIDRVLAHYNSPHKGQGELMARICKEEGINPILMLAVMQKESSYGNRANVSTLKDENIANPWSVHFNERADGINKLRLPNGEMPTFEQSLRGAIRTLKRHAGNSDTPLTTTSVKYCPPHAQTWRNEVDTHFRTQSRRIQNMK
jgi:hypothetical protein